MQTGHDGKHSIGTPRNVSINYVPLTGYYNTRGGKCRSKLGGNWWTVSELRSVCETDKKIARKLDQTEPIAAAAAAAAKTSKSKSIELVFGAKKNLTHEPKTEVQKE